MNTRLLLTTISVLSALAWVPAALAGDAAARGQAAADECNRLVARVAVDSPSASPLMMSDSQQGPLLGRPAAPSARAAESGSAAIAATRPQTTTGPLLGRPAPDPSGVGAPAPAPATSGMAVAREGYTPYEQVYRDCIAAMLGNTK